ncbi:nucleoside diphosphate kinase 3 isoform X3 [Sminthopsis crassicaudata]|uniref:nucleoside diphosphate kinase 3 isoform X3 n=1 Tax=Sminthopsis crassicaudata TaxID=9301 RepID=UPI003D68F9AB
MPSPGVPQLRPAALLATLEGSPRSPRARGAAGRGLFEGPSLPGRARARRRRRLCRFRSAAAIMICLVLTIFANIFPSAWTGLNERTFLAIKPDGFQRRLVGEIIERFEKKGFKLVGLKLVQASEDLLREHYSALRDRPFYTRLVKYMSSGPVVAMGWLQHCSLSGFSLEGVAGAGRSALFSRPHRSNQSLGVLAGHHPRRLLHRSWQKRYSRQRLSGECPPGDRPLVPCG